MTRRDLEDLDRLVADYKAVDQKCGESEDAFCRWSTVRRRLADRLIQNVDEVMAAIHSAVNVEYLSQMLDRAIQERTGEDN